jgi:hypothetical protein
MSGEDSLESGAASVDVEGMIADAFRRVEAFDWAQWAPSADDQLLGYRWYTDKPPLTTSMVALYADFLGWIGGRTLPPAEFEELKETLSQRWTAAATAMDYSAVNDVLAGIVLWLDILQRRLPPEQELQVRTQLQAKMADGVLGELPKAPATRGQATAPLATDVTSAMATSAMRAKLVQDLLQIGRASCRERV